MKKKILIIFGTRPEAIKMAPLIKEFQKSPSEFNVICCVTGQHREMLDQVLNIFEIKPNYDLKIMKDGQDLFDITSKVLIGLRGILEKEKPDFVLVHGDTTSSTAGALAAYYLQIPVVHIEAGLRTFDIYSPWPEEMNRQLTGRLSSYHFSPTNTSKQNLLKEGVQNERIIVCGNTVIDALFYVIKKIRSDIDLEMNIVNSIKNTGYDVSRLQDNKKLILITGHRRENFGEGFINICRAIKELTLKYVDFDFVYPMHLNPNVRKPIEEVFGSESSSNMFFIEPLDYLGFIFLMSRSYLLLTDSGGIQEEAPSLGKPVLVMRNTTERPEALDAGTVKLVGTDYDKIINEVSLLIDNIDYYEESSKASNPYGDGISSQRIVEYLKNIQ